MKPEILFQDADFYSQKAPSHKLGYRRELMSAFLAVSDTLCVSLSVLFAILVWHQIRADLQVEVHLRIIPAAAIFFILIYRLMGLYPAIGVGPVEELKRLTISTSFITLSMITLSFFLRNTEHYSRATLVIAWMLILMSVPISRKLFRRIAAKLGLWGVPIAIVGDKKNVINLQRRLSLHPLSGLLPVLGVSGQIADVFAKERNRARLFSRISTIILATEEGRFDSVRYLITQTKYKFKHIIVIFDETRVGPIWFTPINLVEHLGLEARHNLLNKSQQRTKRVMDIVVIALTTPLLLIIFAFIGVVIKLNSRGPVFYRQKRVGYVQRDFWVWKFRTMFYQADQSLGKHLENNPMLQKEWGENFKLKKDPRITWVGKILRVTSLDELPQIWNVLKGEMSLIGPRPIVEEEISLYGQDFEIYQQVLPGITGLWQISGRNDLPYEERVSLDVHYIQNWSIWLDIHILMHTLIAILQARGAY